MAERHTSMYCSHCRRQTAAIQSTANNVLHLLLSLITCGAWLPIWFLCVLLPGSKRCTICGSTTAGGRFVAFVLNTTGTVLVLLVLACIGYLVFVGR